MSSPTDRATIIEALEIAVQTKMDIGYPEQAVKFRELRNTLTSPGPSELESRSSESEWSETSEWPAPVENGFNEWPSIEFPQFLRALGFEDRSYHNDLCARAQKPLTGYTEENGWPVLVVWCEHERREDREIFDSPRYAVYIHVASDVGCDDHGIQVYAGDDQALCAAAILGLNGRYVVGNDDGAAIGTLVEADGQTKTIWILWDDEEWRSYERSDGSIRYHKGDFSRGWLNDDGDEQVLFRLEVSVGQQ